MFRTLKTYLWDLPEPLRFLLAGGINTLWGYLLFALGLFALTVPLSSAEGWVGEHYYLIIQWLMWALSVPFGAFTLKYYAFQSEGAYLPQALRSYGVYLPAQLLSSFLLVLFLRILRTLAPRLAGVFESIDLTVLIAQLCTVLFATIVSYFGHKYYTFRSSVE
ncbi:MAG: hypothetical protein FWE87_01330 [Coriobacteriia bacterium]|nr:hypothetical protein [Coriobacteriia bacterium]